MINNTLDWIIDKERVREAFKDFVHALVWESRDIEEGASEEEINEHIDLYVKTKGDGKINDFAIAFFYLIHAGLLSEHSMIWGPGCPTRSIR